MNSSDQNTAKNKRFWDVVEIVPQPLGFAVLLDGKPVRVPGAGPLCLPGVALAEAVAAEWRDAGGGAIGGLYAPDALGLTRLAGTMLVRVGPRRAAVIADLMVFLDNELLCYRATHPAPLVLRQHRDWQPWLDWCRSQLGATLAVTDGVMPIRQHPSAQAAIGGVLGGLDDAALTALGVLAPALNSLVLALACVTGALPAGEAHALSVLDEEVQNAQWGCDAQADQRRQAVLADCLEAERFLLLAHPTGSRTDPDTQLLVDGRVQGVGYRAWLQGEATRLGLRGWVRNLGDGRVEARLSGAASAQLELARLAALGPHAAVVRAVTARTLAGCEPLPADASFVVAATMRASEG